MDLMVPITLVPGAERGSLTVVLWEELGNRGNLVVPMGVARTLRTPWRLSLVMHMGRFRFSLW